MADFILVHGGWHGGWCWQQVSDRLSARGHRVFAPSLTGLAERRHLIDKVDGPDTHVADITTLIEFEDLHEVQLVGHSYGGTVITGVASAMPERIKRLVYLDAMVPEVSGLSAMAMTSPERAAEIQASRRADGHTDASGYERWVSPDRIAWLKTRTTPQPGSCFEKGVTLTGRQNDVTSRDYIICARNRPSLFWQFYDRFKDDPAWRCHQLNSLHDAMIEAPEALVALLDP